MIKSDPKKSYEIMGADVKQSGTEVRGLGQIPALAGQGGESEILCRELQEFSKEAAALLTSSASSRARPIPRRSSIPAISSSHSARDMTPLKPVSQGHKLALASAFLCCSSPRGASQRSGASSRKHFSPTR
jgi:hypothetical protein